MGKQWQTYLNWSIWTSRFEPMERITSSFPAHTPKIFPLFRSASVQVNQQGSSACSGSWMAVDSVWHEVTPKELITIPLLHVISFPIWTSFKFLWSRNPVRNYQNIEWHHPSWKIQNVLFFDLTFGQDGYVIVFLFGSGEMSIGVWLQKSIIMLSCLYWSSWDFLVPALFWSKPGHTQSDLFALWDGFAR